MSTQLHVSPIRRVVTLLQMMSKKVEEEGKTEQVLFDKYMCYCRDSETTLWKSVSDAETKVPQLQSDLNAGNAEKAQLDSDIKQAQGAKSEADKTMAEAKALREKQAAEHAKEDAENKANLKALGDALVALRKGNSDSFLQTSGAAILRRFTSVADLPEWDKRTITSFLSSMQEDEASQGESYEPDSQDVIGILSQMHETMAKDIKEADASEKQALADFNSLVSAKTKEVDSISKELLTKNARVGEVGVELVNVAQDLTGVTKQLEQDKAFLADLEKSCKAKEAEWDERSQSRSDELRAIASTIKVLNDDETMNLFKKAVPSASLMQVGVTSKQILHEARQALLGPNGKGQEDPRISIISMAMRGRLVNYDKVTTMVDKMMALLDKEQKDDDAKKSYCNDEIDKAEDAKATLEDQVSDSKKTMANSKEIVSTLSKDILKIAADIKAIDVAVVEATKQRQSEHAAYVEEIADNNAATEILTVAKRTLSQYYKPKSPPKLVQVPPKRKVSLHSWAKADAITVEMPIASKVLPSGNANSGMVGDLQDVFSSFFQTSSSDSDSDSYSESELDSVSDSDAESEIESTANQAPPPPAPSTWSGKRQADGSGVLGLLDTLIKDIQKQATALKADEKSAQAEYETFMADSSKMRTSGTKTLSAKESTKADTEATLQKHSRELKTAAAEATANGEYLTTLHKECDWMLKNFNVRRDARTSEIASLKNAKAVLSGADFSFLQLEKEVKRNLRSTAAHKNN